MLNSSNHSRYLTYINKQYDILKAETINIKADGVSETHVSKILKARTRALKRIRELRISKIDNLNCRPARIQFLLMLNLRRTKLIGSLQPYPCATNMYFPYPQLLQLSVDCPQA